MNLFSKDNAENQKYDIRPEDNMPREVYGIPDFINERNKYDIEPENKLFASEEFKLPKTEKELIEISIKNDKSNYVLLFSKYSDYADFMFVDLNNLDDKNIKDAIINIPLFIFDELHTKLTTLTNNWSENYNGNSINHWSVKIETNETNKLISGNGGFPNNWNQFIDFLVEYEKLFYTQQRLNGLDAS